MISRVGALKNSGRNSFSGVYYESGNTTETRTGADPKEAGVVKPKMFAVEGNENDPVRAYDIYASKRPDDMQTVLFAINHTTKAVNTKSWFRSARMGVNNLNSLVKTIAEKAGLDAKNLTKLNDQGVPPMNITQGHKNVQSLNNY